jgi:hypothetical protein
MRATRKIGEINKALIQIVASSPLVHPVSRSILRTGTPEPLIKLPQRWQTASFKDGGSETGGIKMKKIVILVALICVLGAFAGRPSADVPSHAARDTLSPQAMMQDSRWLPTEAYEAI